jgi:hypothetical protein
MTEILVRNEFYDSSQDMFANQNMDYHNDDSRRDKKHLSLGMLVPDAIQYICSEGQALRWDELASCYEVVLHEESIDFLIFITYRYIPYPGVEW